MGREGTRRKEQELSFSQQVVTLFFICLHALHAEYLFSLLGNSTKIAFLYFSNLTEKAGKERREEKGART